MIEFQYQLLIYKGQIRVPYTLDDTFQFFYEIGISSQIEAKTSSSIYMPKSGQNGIKILTSAKLVFMFLNP